MYSTNQTQCHTHLHESVCMQSNKLEQGINFAYEYIYWGMNTWKQKKYFAPLIGNLFNYSQMHLCKQASLMMVLYI